MSNLKEVRGYYGVSRQTPTTIYVMENRNGSRWYVVDGGVIVNLTWDEIPVGTNVEEISDSDAFTWDEPITSLDELEKAVEA